MRGKQRADSGCGQMGRYRPRDCVEHRADCPVDDGSVVDTKGWQGWEWTHGVALTALYHVGPSFSSHEADNTAALLPLCSGVRCDG